MLLQLPLEVMPALKAKLSQPLRVGTLVALASGLQLCH